MSITTHETKPETKPATGHAAGKTAGPAMNGADTFVNYFSKTNHMMSDTVNDIYQAQRDILSSLAENWRNGFSQRGTTVDYGALTNQAHEQSEKMIANYRRMSDSLRDSAWRLAELYAGSFEQAAKQISALVPGAKP